MGSDSDEDRRERDEFAQRLKKRDEGNTRKVAARSGNSIFFNCFTQINSLSSFYLIYCRQESLRRSSQKIET